MGLDRAAAGNLRLARVLIGLARGPLGGDFTLSAGFDRFRFSLFRLRHGSKHSTLRPAARLLPVNGQPL